MRAEPETALLCFSKNKHDVENDTKMNAVRELLFFGVFFGPSRVEKLLH